MRKSYYIWGFFFCLLKKTGRHNRGVQDNRMYVVEKADKRETPSQNAKPQGPLSEVECWEIQDRQNTLLLYTAHRICSHERP